MKLCVKRSTNKLNNNSVRQEEKKKMRWLREPNRQKKMSERENGKKIDGASHQTGHGAK